MRKYSSRALVAASMAALALLSCDPRDPIATDPLDDAALALLPGIPELPAPGDFVDPSGDPNPYLPLVRGTVYTYQADTEDGLEETVVTVTNQNKTILGIVATVVLDEVYLGGSLIEQTFDWFAQDRWGNVWYLGEESCEFEEEGGPCNPAGSWEAGVSGAEAGIVMWADPAAHQGKTYRQEFFEGEAEDLGKVLRTGISVSVPAGDYHDCIETMDWSPLEPGGREQKYYCAGTGRVLEVSMRGGNVRNELVSVVWP